LIIVQIQIETNYKYLFNSESQLQYGCVIEKGFNIMHALFYSVQEKGNTTKASSTGFLPFCMKQS